MPYEPGNTASLPAYVQKLSAKRRRQWAHIWNSSYKSCMAGANPDSGACESRAFSVASGVVIRQKGKAKHAMDEPSSDADFKELTTEGRKKIPKGKFLFIDSNGTPHLPVHDAAHIRNAISRLGQSKTGRKWGLTAEKRASLQARARRMLDRAQHNQGPSMSPYADLALDVATFKIKDQPLRVDDEVVYCPATIFRAGEYPDKKFSLTPSELKEAAAKFESPIAVDYEHIEGPLDGHMGRLVAVEPSEDGSKLHGMLAVPRWLHGVLPKAKLSATWDRASKTLVGLALVRNPRVSDASLFAAFSVDQVARGKQPIASLFKTASDKADDDDDDDDDDKGKDSNPFVEIAKKRNAAKAKKKGKSKAPFAGYDGMVPAGGQESQSGGSLDADDDEDDDSDDVDETPDDERTAPFAARGSAKRAMAQAVHNIACSRGAMCKPGSQPGKASFDEQGEMYIDNQKIAKFARGGKAMQSIHDVSLCMGASCARPMTMEGQRSLTDAGPFQWEYPGVKEDGRSSSIRGGMTRPHFSEAEEEGSMGQKKSQVPFDKMLASLDTQTGVYTPGSYDYAGQPSRRTPSDDRQKDERIAHLEEENRLMRQQTIYDRAVSFADKAVEQGHVLPAEREQVLRQHMQAAHDDTFVGTASFSDGNSRVAQFEEWILSRPKHGMDVEATQEALREAAAVFNNMRTTLVPGSRNSPGVENGAPMTSERRSYLLNLADSGTMTGRNQARPPSNGTAH